MATVAALASSTVAAGLFAATSANAVVTNTGIRAITGGGTHGHSEDDVRYVRRRYLSAEVARTIAVEIANATFAARTHGVWAPGQPPSPATPRTSVRSTRTCSPSGTPATAAAACSSTGTSSARAWRSTPQLISCSASEVAAMIEGAMRHGTMMEVEGNYTDSHGQSEVGVGITRLLGFDLLPRIKRINKVRLYLPAGGRGGGRLPPAGARADPADPVGHHRRAVRPDDQVLHRHPGGHRLHRGDPAPVHPRQRDPPRLTGPSSSWAGLGAPSSPPATYATGTCSGRSTRA